MGAAHVGLLGTKPSQDVMEECDTLLMVGTSFPYIEFLPKPGQARVVQIDLDPARSVCAILSKPVCSAQAATRCALCRGRLERKEDRSFLEAQAGMKDWWQLMEGRGTREDLPVKPQVILGQSGIRLCAGADRLCCVRARLRRQRIYR